MLGHEMPVPLQLTDSSIAEETLFAKLESIVSAQDSADGGGFVVVTLQSEYVSFPTEVVERAPGCMPTVARTRGQEPAVVIFGRIPFTASVRKVIVP